MSLVFYEDRFSKLHVGRAGTHERPHKPVMLLALLDLFAQGAIKENRVPFSPELLELFSEYFEAVREKADRAMPIHPWFFLREDKFWHHHAISGKEEVLGLQKAPPGVKAFQAMSDYVFLDDELYALLQKSANRAALREVLITRYFPELRAKVSVVAKKEAKICEYERKLDARESVTDGPAAPDYVRQTAFNRIVRRAYDYRCAACGLRVVMEGGLSIVDAAHLIPYALSHDDDPRNGIALCKNHHWAMEQNLIAPGSDRLWHVLSTPDDRLEGQRELVHLDERKVLLPKETRYHPKPDALLWRERELARV